MFDVTSTRSLVESALLAGLAVVLFLAAHFLPFVGAAFSLICPAPLVILGLRHDLRKASLGLGVASILVAAFLGPLTALFFLLGFGVLGVGLGYLAKRCRGGVDIMMYGILISLGSKLLLMVIVSRVTGINPFQLDSGEMQSVVDRVFKFYQSSGMSRETLAAVQAQFAESIKMLPVIFPTLLTLAAAMDCFLSYVTSGAVLRRLSGKGLPPLPPFSRWRFPRSVFLAFLVSMVLTALGSRSGEMSLSLRVGTNLRLLVNFLFLFQGLSLIWFFMKGGDAPSGKGERILGGIVIIVAVLVPLLSSITVMAGICDMWLDLRLRFGRGDAS